MENTNTPPSSDLNLSKSANNSKVKEMVDKGKEMVGNNSGMIITVVVVYLVIMTAYFLSKTYRVRNTYEKLNKYEVYMMLTDRYLKENKMGEVPLKEFMGGKFI